MPNVECILALDIGTTGLKACLFRTDGRLMAEYSIAYATSTRQPGYAEQSPDDWWGAACVCVRRLVRRRAARGAEIVGIGLSGMMNGCVLVDRSGNSIRPALIHADLRGEAMCPQLAAELDPTWVYRTTGNRLAPYFTLAKLAWLARHEPESVTSASWCIQAKDYIAGKLTGRWGITDSSDASLTSLYDLEARRWSDPILSAAGASPTMMPEVLPSTSLIGSVSAEAARAMEIPAGTPVVQGGGDGACATAGAGAVAPGAAYHCLGGTSWLAEVLPSYQPDPEMRLSTFIGLAPSQFVRYGTSQSSGVSIDWVKQLLFGSTGQARMETAAASVESGANGLVFLPYLQGERSPIWDAAARGVLIGLRPDHGKAHIARSVYEGVAYALGSILQEFRRLGSHPAEIRGLGGGMRSELLRTLLAEVYGIPIRSMANLSGGTSAGAAMAAAVGLGVCRDWNDALRFAPTAELTEPHHELQDTYSAGLERFMGLYPIVAPAFRGTKVDRAPAIEIAAEHGTKSACAD